MMALRLCDDAMRLTLRVLGGNGLREGQSFERRYRDFQAMCSEPGVRCVVEFSPAYLMTHRGIEVPRSIVGEFADDDGRMQ